MKAHAAVAAYLLDDDPLVRAVITDIETAPVSDAVKALLHFVEKVNRSSTAIGRHDIETLYGFGWTDEGIYDAITVCALFNFYNRWIDATGVHAMSDEAHRASAVRMAPGYLRTVTE